MSEAVFERASKLKLRFAAGRGSLAVEDLWDLGLNDLDNLAKQVNKLVKDSQEESFIPSAVTRKPTTHDSLKLEILKRVIEVKVEENDKKKARAEKAMKIAKLKELAETKSTEKLASQSLEDILKQIAEIEKDE